MTPQQLHDALTLLPLDLVEAATQLRAAPRPPSRRIAWVPLAASFALVLLCGWFINGMFHTGAKSTESILTNEAAAQIQEREDTSGSGSADATPEETPQEGESLPSLLAVMKAPISPDSSVNYTSPPLVQVITQAEDLPVAVDLPEDWFDSHDILAFFFTGCPEPPVLPSIQEEEGQWCFTFPDQEPSPEGTDWYLLLQTAKGRITEDQILVCFLSQSG